MHWTSLVRVNFQFFKLDKRMLLGYDKVIKVRESLSRSGSEEKLVRFDKGFVLFWIDEFVLKALGLESIQELSELYQKIRGEIDAESR